MKILITGSSGLVGSEVKQLLLKKHTIIEYNASEGKDILNKAELEMQMKGIDTVIHLAATIENTNLNLWEVNVKGTKNVIEAATKNGVNKFIYLSSTGVYGTPKGQVSEKSETNPLNNYEKSKLEAEKIILANQEKIHINIIRSAMVLGNNTYWQGMFKLLKNDSPLPCNGNNNFQIISLKELARVIELVIRKGKKGETYLASGKEKLTLNEFCSLCKKELKMKETRMKHVPTILAIIFGKITNSSTLTSENIRHLSKERNYNLRKLNLLGYKQKDNLQKSLQEIIQQGK